MSKPSQTATNLQASLIGSRSFYLNWTAGNGSSRIVAVTQADYGAEPNIKAPTDGVIYNSDLHYGNGDNLVDGFSGSNYPYPTCYACAYPEDSTATASSSTYVVYEGDDYSEGINIINLEPQKDYYVTIYEHNDYCYLIPDDVKQLRVTTAFLTNEQIITVYVINNRTRLTMANASVSIKNRDGVIADFGETNGDGKFVSIKLPEGMYWISVVVDGFEPKILSGVFIQRQEPRRDTNYKMWSPNGNTVINGDSERARLRNKNEYKIFLDESNTNLNSFNRYNAQRNPSRNTRL